MGYPLPNTISFPWSFRRQSLLSTSRLSKVPCNGRSFSTPLYGWSEVIVVPGKYWEIFEFQISVGYSLSHYQSEIAEVTISSDGQIGSVFQVVIFGKLVTYLDGVILDSSFLQY